MTQKSQRARVPSVTAEQNDCYSMLNSEYIFSVRLLITESLSTQYISCDSLYLAPWMKGNTPLILSPESNEGLLFVSKVFTKIPHYQWKLDTK